MKVITHMQYGTQQSDSVQFLKCNISNVRPFLHCWQSPRTQEVHFFACWNNLLILRQFWSEQGHATHWNACAKIASNFLICKTNLQDYSLNCNDKGKVLSISCLLLQVRIHVILRKPISLGKQYCTSTCTSTYNMLESIFQFVWGVKMYTF